ncbi:MAG: antA/AntB antirepressor family protein [Xanthomonadales bacterium]|nr:antA/AntB antirepressor family protein [Xanthomonadales bacterium]
MPTAIVPVFAGQIHNTATQICNARDLHAALHVGRDFSNWIKGRIDSYGFVEDEDYLLAKIGEQLPSGTKYRIDYHLTLDMAKELAMLENNPIGRQVRRYFIQMEQQARTPTLLQPTRAQLLPYNPVIGDSSTITLQNAAALLKSLCGANLTAPQTSMLCSVISSAISFESNASTQKGESL